MSHPKPSYSIALKTGILVFLFCSSNVRGVLADDPANGDTFTPQYWDLHFQTTFLPQYHGSFPAAYSGKLSLNPGPELAASFTATAFLGLQVWKGGFLYYDPEIPAGA
ncbi:MAG TPA: hypothetical protein VN963_00945, partial [bacterium]|nr:hypothetical protein [bacterium]